MAKIVLDTVTGGYDLSVINNNFDKIETEFQNKVLYRDNPVGEPNTLQTDIDANSKRIYNLPEPLLDSQAARLQDIQNAIAGGAANLIPFTPYKNIASNNIQSAIQEEIDDLESTAGAGMIGILDAGSKFTGSTVEGALSETATLAQLAASSGSSLVGFLQAGTAAVSRTEQSKLRDTVNVKDFGARGDGITNDASAFTAAYAYLITLGGGELVIPVGTYKIDSTLALTGTGANQNSANIHIRGAGGYSTILDFNSALANTDGIQIVGAGRITIQGIAIKNAKRYGINVNSGQVPGDPTFVSRFAIRDVIVDNATSHGIRLANAYMGLLEDIESRNNGGNGFHFEGNHTSITAIRCWAGGDGSDPNGGNAGTGWFINGIIYSSFIGCGADWNSGPGYTIHNCSGLTFQSCGSESNGGEGWLVTSSLANSTGSPVTGIDSIKFTGCFGFNNSLAGVNSYANFIGTVTANSLPASVSISGCNDLLAGGQTVSAVFNGTSGQIKLFDYGNNLAGTRTYTGDVVNGDFLTASQSSGSSSVLSSGVVANAGSPAVTITLPAGDWDVWGVADFNPAATTSITNLTAGISTTSATFGGQDSFIANRMAAQVPNGVAQINTPRVRIRSTGTTVVYLVVVATFTVSNLSAYGSLFAKRST